MAREGGLSARLHSGEVSYPFIDRKKVWFLVSAILIAVSIASLGVRQLNFGVEFSGGSVFQFQAPNATESGIRSTVSSALAEENVPNEVIVQTVSGGKWRVQTPSLPSSAVTDVQQAIAQEVGIGQNDVSQEQIGPTWGLQVSKKAGLGLLIFLGICVVFLWVVFEWKMALAAMLALVHDLVITAGIYSLVGFEVTPATVIGFLTILGYSLYDTVVVFDKVRENTGGILGGNRTTYSRSANLAVNQTLARSINTSVVALLPVAAILFVGSAVLGAGTLQDLSLALFVGIATGAYSSIFIATPILTMLKEREPKMASLRRRVEARETAQSGPEAAATGGQRSRRTAAAGTGKGSAPAGAATGTKVATAASGDGGNGVPSGGTVSVTAPAAGSAARGGSQDLVRRGSQRPQPKRSGSKRKGKKKR